MPNLFRECVDGRCSGGGGLKGGATMTYGIGRIPEDVDPIEERLAELEAMELTGTTYKRPSDYLVCKSCGQSGRKGSYPFSTCPGSGYCDDCFG